MKSFQLAHHLAVVVMSPAKQLITVGRLRTPRRVLIVLVMRSGIDASRLSPSVLSFMKPETILRGAYSASHRAATSSIPGQPCATISALSSAHIAGVNTVETATSRAPGASMNDCTSAISLLYAASSCVIQYSNGLLLIAAMFHVTSLSTSERGARDIRRLTKPSSAIAASDSTTSRRVRFGGLSRDASPRKAASSSSGSDGVRNSRSAFMSRARVRMYSVLERVVGRLERGVSEVAWSAAWSAASGRATTGTSASQHALHIFHSTLGLNAAPRGR